MTDREDVSVHWAVGGRALCESRLSPLATHLVDILTARASRAHRAHLELGLWQIDRLERRLPSVMRPRRAQQRRFSSGVTLQWPRGRRTSNGSNGGGRVPRRAAA
jgi:hypothetical protein